MTLPNKNSNSISISQINTEVTSSSSNSLKTLSDAAKAGSDPKDGQPYGIGEFSLYSHGPSTQTITYTQNGPNGKIQQYFSSNHSTTTMAFGTVALSSFVNQGSGFFRIQWSGGRNDSWTSVNVGGTVLQRTNASSTSTTTHFYNAQSFYTVGTTATFTYS